MKIKSSMIMLVFAALAVNLHAASSALPAPLPEFMNQQQLATWNAEHASARQSVASAREDSTQFYTGKPYVADAGGYVYKYRTYNPEMSRWTSADPSGFPDGSNNQRYCSNPNTSIDSLGLYVGTPYSITYGSTTYTNTSDEYKWAAGQAAFAAAGYAQAVEAMNHADGATPGNWTLSSSDTDYITSTSQYGEGNKSDGSTIYGYIQNILSDTAYNGYTGSVTVDDTHVLIGDQYSNGYYAFGHVDIEVTGTMTQDNGQWSVEDATVTLTKSSWSFAGDGPPGVSPSTPTAVGYRLQTNGWLQAFSVNGTWDDSWNE